MFKSGKNFTECLHLVCSLVVVVVIVAVVVVVVVVGEVSYLH